MEERPARKILLIEDDAEQARIIDHILENLGSNAWTLARVNSVGEGERLLAERSFEVALLKLEMPGAKGLEAVRRIRAAAPRVPIVLLSDPEDEPFATLAIQEGAQDYLISDQIQPGELRRVLLNAINRKTFEEALFNEKERAQVTLECIGDAVVCTDISGSITFLNRVAEKMTGWVMNDAAGRTMGEVCRILDAATRRPILDPMAKAAFQDKTGSLPLNSVLVRRDGTEILIEDSVAPIRDRVGQVTGAVIVFRDVTATRALEAKLTHDAHHDPLTGLPNRLLLNDRAAQAIALARRQKGQVATLFLDLDGFKDINDSLGHSIGDKLLQSVAERLRGCVRSPDTVSRQGGDEFVVLLQELSRPEDSAVTATRLLKAVAEVHQIGQHQVSVTASIGISVYPDDGKDMETLFKNADIAMYRAKKHGRRSFEFFGSGSKVHDVESSSLEQDLRRALERNEFKLHYQSKVDLRTGAIIGAEALLRWAHPVHGVVPPAKFIPVAEDSGLILPIGAWVLREACTQARIWADAGVPARTVAVNISAMQLESPDFVEGLFAILEATGLKPGSLELELTESVLMKNPERTKVVLKALKEKGVQVSVDNYGTGETGLATLRELSLDAIKIDGTFVRRITTDPYENNKVSAMINMGQSLDLRVIAEGVETAGNLEFLWEHGCDQAQGYFFGQPAPAEQMESRFKQDLH